jgi:hypothetical protein
MYASKTDNRRRAGRKKLQELIFGHAAAATSTPASTRKPLNFEIVHQPDDIFHRPQAIRDLRGHRRRSAQGLMDANEIVSWRSRSSAG